MTDQKKAFAVAFALAASAMVFLLATYLLYDYSKTLAFEKRENVAVEISGCEGAEIDRLARRLESLERRDSKDRIALKSVNEKIGRLVEGFNRTQAKIDRLVSFYEGLKRPELKDSASLEPAESGLVHDKLSDAMGRFLEYEQDDKWIDIENEKPLVVQFENERRMTARSEEAEHKIFEIFGADSALNIDIKDVYCKETICQVEYNSSVRNGSSDTSRLELEISRKFSEHFIGGQIEIEGGFSSSSNETIFVRLPE